MIDFGKGARASKRAERARRVDASTAMCTDDTDTYLNALHKCDDEDAVTLTLEV